MTLDESEQLGLDGGRVEDLVTRAEREVREGLLPSCQLALARHGRLALFVALGQATRRSRFVVFSVTKAVMAGAVWAVMAEDRLDPAARVAGLVPGFGTNGKDAVTVEHLLLHTAGFPRAPMDPVEGATREGRLRRFRQWRLDWQPGTRYEYHPTSAHWVLAEVVERVRGQDYRGFVEGGVIRPLGLSTLRLGVPPAEQGDVLPLLAVGGPLDPEVLRGVGVSSPDLMLAELSREKLLRFNQPEVREAGVPGAGAVATAADVALYFQALLHDPGGVWDPAVLADGTGRVRNRLPDPFTGAPANRTRGLVVAGDDGYAAFRGFAPEAGPRAFGSPGVGGQIAWADPDSGLSFCYLTNGLDGDIVRAARRSLSLSSRAVACAAR